MSLGSRTWRQIRWSINRRGMWGTSVVVLQRLLGLRKDLEPSRHPFDKVYGVDTGGYIAGGMLGVGHEHDNHIVSYYAVQPSRLMGGLSKWKSMEGTYTAPEYTFLDVGAGKGRAMLIAAELGFREVVGVELNPDLVTIAQQNLQKWRDAGRAKSQMRIVQGDVIEMTLPEGPLVVFLYNPFHAPVLRLLLQKLAFTGRVGEVDIIYMVPLEEIAFKDFPQFKLMWDEKLPMSDADRDADLVSGPEDRCVCYRLIA